MVEVTFKRRIKLTKPCIGKEELEAVRKVLESGWLTEGPVTAKLEKKVANYVGSKYAIATCNCTVALELCLRALNIHGQVIVPDFTHPATAQAVLNTGATPILQDVELENYLITPSLSSFEAVIPVSWAGHPILDYAWGCPIVEDAACSLGSSYLNTKTGSEFTSCFSFHPRKLVACGEGGIITTNDGELAAKIRSLKNFGEDSTVLTSQKWDGTYNYFHWCSGQVDFIGSGTNAKLSDVNAAIALCQMDKLDRIIARRVEMAQIYDELLVKVKNVRPPQKTPNTVHTYQTYAVYLEKADRNKVISKLAEKGIETQIGTYALHLLTTFKYLPSVGSLDNSEKLYRNLLALPMAYDSAEEDQKYVVDELKKCVS